MLCVMQLSAVFFGLGGVLVGGSDDLRCESPRRLSRRRNRALSS